MYLYHIFIHRKSFCLTVKEKKALEYLIFNLSIKSSLEEDDLLKLLVDGNFAPPVDFVRKWSEKVKSNFWEHIYPMVYKKKGGTSVLILREWFRSHPDQVNNIIKKSENYGFQLVDVFDLENCENNLINKNIRGGVWYDSTRSAKAGGPFLGMVFSSNNQDIREFKNQIRADCSVVQGELINVVHSSDDHTEAEQYLNIFRTAKCNVLKEKLFER